MFVVKFINVCCIFTSITDMLSKKAKGINTLVFTAIFLFSGKLRRIVVKYPKEMMTYENER